MTFDKEKERERRIKSLMNRCKHFNGIQNQKCEAGITYDVFSDEFRLKHLPCFKDTSNGKVCKESTFLSREDAIQEEDKSEVMLANLLIARKIIVEHSQGKKRVIGHIECPVCKGTLSYSVASNGHIHAQCRSGNCLSWME